MTSVGRIVDRLPGLRPPGKLRSRLLVSHLLVAVAALGTVLVAVSLIGPGYFAEAMGHGAADALGERMAAVTLAAFQEAVRTALIAGLLIALTATTAVAVALAGPIAGPITRTIAAARRISAGHYSERVPPAGIIEVGELADTFNAMAASLEATERRRLDLVGDVAHELRTPLATLDAYLEGLEDGVVAAEPETWTLLRLETSRLARLVDDLSELWRAEARQLTLRIEEIDVGTIADEVVARFRPSAELRRIEVRSNVPPVLNAQGDRHRVAQVLGNYLANAIRYAPEMVVFHPARKSFAELARKWDRHIAHDFNERAGGFAGRLKWAGLTLAVAASSVLDVHKIIASRRIGTWRERRMAAGLLARIRLFRATRMLLLLAHQQGTSPPVWNRQ